MNSPGARAVVEELLVNYVACLDDGRFEEWPDHFTENCRYQIISRSSQQRGLPSGFYFCVGAAGVPCLNQPCNSLTASRLVSGWDYKAERSARPKM